jgi:hypothetical protein
MLSILKQSTSAHWLCTSKHTPIALAKMSITLPHHSEYDEYSSFTLGCGADNHNVDQAVSTNHDVHTALLSSNSKLLCLSTDFRKHHTDR